MLEKYIFFKNTIICSTTGLFFLCGATIAAVAE